MRLGTPELIRMPFEGQFLHSWLRKIGVSRMTGWRWIKQGRIKVTPIYGRNYISNEEIERFFREGAAHSKRIDAQNADKITPFPKEFRLNFDPSAGSTEKIQKLACTAHAARVSFLQH